MKTKIAKIMKGHGWTQGDLLREIYYKTGFLMGRDRISKIVNGITFNYSVETALMLSRVLKVNVDDILEKKLLPYKKESSKYYLSKRGRPSNKKK